MKIKFSIGCFLFPLFLFSQKNNGSISGFVLDEKSHPLVGATVSINGFHGLETTDTLGFFRWNDLPSGQTTLQFSHLGFETRHQKVVVEAQKTISLKIILKENNHQLDEITIREFALKMPEMSPLPDVHSNFLMAGRKSEVIDVANLQANVTEKTGRQIFSKIPGAFIYDMDGSGNQVNLSTRGLDPHRSWELNVRQNGVLTNSDMYGYPASHYSPPMEAIGRIELVRGTASLQYGAQFGGLINYETKKADTTRPFSYEGLQTVGAFGLMSTFNSAGGTVGKFHYYGYVHRRVSDGYRENAKTNATAQFLSIGYDFSKTMKIRAEIGHSSYVFKIPGPLNDSLFLENSRQATRSRNYFNPDILVPSLTFDWKMTPKTSLRLLASGVFGERRSVQFVGFSTVPDTILANRQYKNRQVDIDGFNSKTIEARLLHHYFLLKMKNTLAGGFQLIFNDLHRRQQGKGTTGTDYDLSLVANSTWGRDLHFKTQNVALFLENQIWLTPRWAVSPGFRIENGVSRMSGFINYLPSDRVPFELKHRFPLVGINSQVLVSEKIKAYGGWSQAYRPIIFADLIPADTLNRSDKNLVDAHGSNAEIGLRGKLNNRFTFDLTAFQIRYIDRIGSEAVTDATGKAYILKTNLGSTTTRGLEIYLEYRWLEKPHARASVFTSTSVMNGAYTSGSVVSSGENKSLVGNQLEGVPHLISRNGCHFLYKTMALTLQHSFVGESFSDAQNTRTPTKNGANGLVPSYHLWDLNGSWRFQNRFSLKAGINNLFNKNYFTKRPTIYPGPGVWSSDGRSWTMSLGLTF